MKGRALYLLMEAGWEMESIPEALGVTASIERWEENYGAIHLEAALLCAKSIKAKIGQSNLPGFFSGQNASTDGRNRSPRRIFIRHENE